MSVSNFLNKIFKQNMQRVFVYGTLKRGEPNHSWLSNEKGHASFVSMGKTLTNYPLIIGTKYNIPFVLDSPGKGELVKGEVYEVDDAMLANLDILEDHPTFYEREIRPVTLLKDSNDNNLENDVIANCWIYLIKNFKPELLQQQYFEEYSSKGSHGKEYVLRYARDPNYHARTDVLN